MEGSNESYFYKILEKLEAHERRVDARLLRLEQELFFYKRVIKWIQVGGAFLMALVTFKFGDIRGLFK
jgi:hypothetical protein